MYDITLKKYAIRMALNDYMYHKNKKLTKEDRLEIEKIVNSGSYDKLPKDFDKSLIDKYKCRYVILYEGEGMGDDVYIFVTNIEKEVLKATEKLCQKMKKNGYEYIPTLSEILDNDFDKLFAYDNSCQNVTPYGTSNDWLEQYYPNVKETYYLYYSED